MLAMDTNLKRVECVAFHPGGRLVAVGGPGVELWDVRAMEPVWQVGWEAGTIAQVAFNADGRSLLALLPGCSLRLFDIVSADVLADRWQQGGGPWFWTPGPGGGRATIGNASMLESWAVAGEAIKHDFDAAPEWSTGPAAGRFRGIAATPAGDTLLTHELDHDGGGPRRAVFRLRDPATGAALRSVRCPFHTFDALAFSPDGSRLVARLKNELLIWDAARLRLPPTRVRNDSARGFTDLAFHPAGRQLAAASNDRTVKLFDTDTWAVVRSYGWAAGRMRSIAFDPDGLVATAGGDQGQLVLFDVDV